MTITQALKIAVAKLSAKNFDNPPLEAEILLSHILKKPREFILSHSEKKLTKLQITNYSSLIDRRMRGEPIAYLIKQKEFYGLNFFVNKNVLIPRPETELMVDEALKLITHNTKHITHNSQHITLIDVGTGSGCIVIALAKLLNNELRIKNYELIATDISQKALSVAKKNAIAHQVAKNIKFLNGNLIEPLFKNLKLKIKNSKILILANLPYLTPTQIKNSPSIKYEPKNALFAGKNGLELYKKLFEQLKKFNVLRVMCYELCVTCYVLCEFNPRQTVLIKKLIKKYLPQSNLQIKKDLAGLNRLAIIKLTSS